MVINNWWSRAFLLRPSTVQCRGGGCFVPPRMSVMNKDRAFRVLTPSHTWLRLYHRGRGIMPGRTSVPVSALLVPVSFHRSSYPPSPTHLPPPFHPPPPPPTPSLRPPTGFIPRAFLLSRSVAWNVKCCVKTEQWIRFLLWVIFLFYFYFQNCCFDFKSYNMSTFLGWP